MIARCEFCGEELRIDTAMIEVIGWTKRRSAGGMNQIVHARETHRYAHRACVEAERIAATMPDQPGLWSEG